MWKMCNRTVSWLILGVIFYWSYSCAHRDVLPCLFNKTEEEEQREKHSWKPENFNIFHTVVKRTAHFFAFFLYPSACLKRCLAGGEGLCFVWPLVDQAVFLRVDILAVKEIQNLLKTAWPLTFQRLKCSTSIFLPQGHHLGNYCAYCWQINTLPAPKRKNSDHASNANVTCSLF